MNAEIVHRLENSMELSQAATGAMQVANEVMVALTESTALNQKLQKKLEERDQFALRTSTFLDEVQKQIQALGKAIVEKESQNPTNKKPRK